MKNFTYHSAKDSKEATKLSSSNSAFLAGGMTTIPSMKLGLASYKDIIDIKGIKKLSGIKVSGKSVIIGATTKHAEVANSKEVKKAAKYVMDNPAEIPLHSIRTIASNAAVNPSTMVRLITILGFKRYDEFKTIYKKAASQMPVSNFTSHAKDLLNEKHKNPYSDPEPNL